MTTEDIIIHIFCHVDDQLPEIKKHTQAKLYPSEIVTIGILFALRGGYFRPFYRWLHRDFFHLFARLPHRTRLLRLLETHQDWCDSFLAEASFFTVIDSYPIELLFPIRQGRSNGQVGKKSKDKGRWFIGIKLCWLLNEEGQVVGWDFKPANTPDKAFHHLISSHEGESIVLADLGFRSATDMPQNLKLCPKGTWNERMVIETALSMVTMVCDLKRIRHRKEAYISARLAFVTAMFNVLLKLFHKLHPQADPYQMSIAQFAL